MFKILNENAELVEPGRIRLCIAVKHLNLRWLEYGSLSQPLNVFFLLQ